MDSDLSSILSGEPASEEPQQEQQPVETPQPQEQEPEEQQGTGEEATASPAEPKKEEPLDRAAEGLKAAATAERKKRQEAEQRALQLQQELETLRRTQQLPPQVYQQEQRDDDPKPLRQQYETEDEWLDARDAWRDRRAARETEARQQEQAANELRTKTEGVIAQAMAIEGFDLQAFSRVPVTEAMFDAILESDVAPRLVHYLQTNADDAARIAQLPAARQIKELARIEDRLAEPEPEQPPVKERPQLPKTLTEARDSRGRFTKDAYEGPTPLNAILK
jgi:acetyl/propionyl-CoA carboxylase alpha subunit